MPHTGSLQFHFSASTIATCTAFLPSSSTNIPSSPSAGSTPTACSFFCLAHSYEFELLNDRRNEDNEWIIGGKGYTVISACPKGLAFSGQYHAGWFEMQDGGTLGLRAVSQGALPSRYLMLSRYSSQSHSAISPCTPFRPASTSIRIRADSHFQNFQCTLTHFSKNKCPCRFSYHSCTRPHRNLRWSSAKLPSRGAFRIETAPYSWSRSPSSILHILQGYQTHTCRCRYRHWQRPLVPPRASTPSHSECRWIYLRCCSLWRIALISRPWLRRVWFRSPSYSAYSSSHSHGWQKDWCCHFLLYSGQQS